MRRRRFVRRSSRGGKNLVWVTTIVTARVADSGIGVNIGDLVLPVDWVSTTGFDHCTLLAIRGSLSIQQTAAATDADATAGYFAIAVNDELSAQTFEVGLAVEYPDFDVLDTKILGFKSSTTQLLPIELRVKAKRRLKSTEAVRAWGYVDTDTGSPFLNVNAIVRALLQTD